MDTKSVKTKTNPKGARPIGSYVRTDGLNPARSRGGKPAETNAPKQDHESLFLTYFITTQIISINTSTPSNKKLCNYLMHLYVFVLNDS